ncbi:MAG: polyphenol oxidase family protein [Deltaproteobacteria bacterium]|nr:polyphenol oxidase family protein [Deltaproteobacteria bacterium]MBW2694024.1 polyphenol oxidase family protein [Deltaproteobacteria bacterium]
MNVALPLRHALLSSIGVDHGFGLRGFAELADLRCPRQVHGVAVATAAQCAERDLAPEADAVISEEIGVRIAVVTADCLPILLAGDRGRAVAAIHAGWRGLAAGVIGAGLAALRDRLGKSERVTAVIGPHIGNCCYEVDEPVLAALELHFSEILPRALRQTRPGHAQLDLGLLAREALRAAGVERERIGYLEGACTACDAERFYSYRRDGPETGRLVHFISAGHPIAEG